MQKNDVKNNKTKRGLSFFALLLMVLPLFGALFCLPSRAVPAPPDLDEGSSVLIYHNESGKVLFEKGEKEMIPVGPAPRMMAALVFLEHYGKNLEQTVTVNRRVTGLASSTMNPGLKGGEELTVYQLLCGMLIANSDDAVYALAFDMYEDAENAPELLLSAINDKAKALGMEDTFFVNITGADPKSTEELASTGSLSDLLTLALEFQKETVLCDICRIDDLTLPETNKSGERRLLTRNYLLSAKRIGGYTYKYATGLAASEGQLSGYHTLATAKIGNKTFTCISVGALERYAAFTDAARLFDWAEGAYSYKKVLSRTEILGEIAVALSGDSDYVTVVPEKDLSAFLPRDAEEKDIRLVPNIEFDELTAPVYEGLIVGFVTVYYGDEAVGSTRLVTTGSLAVSNSRYYLSLARRFFETPMFLSLAAGVVLFCILCVLAGARVQYLRQNSPASLDFLEEEEGKAPAVSQKAEASFAWQFKRFGRGMIAKLAKTKKESVAPDLQKNSQKNGEKQGAKQAVAEKKEEQKPISVLLKEEQAGLGGAPDKEAVKEQSALKKADDKKTVSSPESMKSGKRFTGAKRLPGVDPALEAKKMEERQGGYVPSGWGSRKDEQE